MVACDQHQIFSGNINALLNGFLFEITCSVNKFPGPAASKGNVKLRQHRQKNKFSIFNLS